MSEFIDKNLESLPEEALEGVNGGVFKSFEKQGAAAGKEGKFNQDFSPKHGEKSGTIFSPQTPVERGAFFDVIIPD